MHAAAGGVPSGLRAAGHGTVEDGKGGGREGKGKWEGGVNGGDIVARKLVWRNVKRVGLREGMGKDDGGEKGGNSGTSAAVWPKANATVHAPQRPSASHGVRKIAQWHGAVEPPPPWLALAHIWRNASAKVGAGVHALAANGQVLDPSGIYKGHGGVIDADVAARGGGGERSPTRVIGGVPISPGLQVAPLPPSGHAAKGAARPCYSGGVGEVALIFRAQARGAGA